MSSDAVEQLTRRRLSSKVRALFNEIALLYEKKPNPGFLDALEREFAALDQKLTQRPLSTMQIESACEQTKRKLVKELLK